MVAVNKTTKKQQCLSSQVVVLGLRTAGQRMQFDITDKTQKTASVAPLLYAALPAVSSSFCML